MNYGYLFTEKLGTDILWAREYCLMFVCLLSTPDQTHSDIQITVSYLEHFSVKNSTLVMWRAGWAAGTIYSVQIF